jgi:pimeloyl-ACP methyl ester carboxylesterase
VGRVELGVSESAAQVVTIDHQIPHVSSVPATQGQLVHLFVRERLASNWDGRTAVLMLHGMSVPVLPGMDLREDHYDWALWLAQSGGFDVFMLDFEGSGLSPRPTMDDPCNVPAAQQSALLVPNPLPATCEPSYPFALVTAQSDWDALDTVVEYIRNLRGVEKVHLVSWSQGSFRAGPYAAWHHDKVASLFLFAPIFNHLPGPANAENPPAILPGPGTPPVGTPMSLRTRDTLFGLWRPEVKCENQREEGIEDVVWSAIMDSDPIGRTWGPPPAGAPAGSAPEGVMRVRTPTLWGWNRTRAGEIQVPTAIFQGEYDTGGGGPQSLAELYSYIPHPNKLRFRVQCTGHWTVWERQRRVLHAISKQWIKHNEVGGFAQGEFYVDSEGNLYPL